MTSTTVVFLLLLVCVTAFNPNDEHAQGRIVGGHSASYKYRRGVGLVFLYRNGIAYKHCTASILSYKYLLTAAHCLLGYTHERLGVLPTAYNVGPEYTVTLSQKAHFIKNAYIHKSYKTKTVYGDRRFDIAMVELEKPLAPGSFTPVRIVSPPRNTTRVKALGYGATGEYRPTSRVLQEAPVVVRPFDWCMKHEQHMEKNHVVAEKQHFCATSIRYPQGRTDTCYGDSGGPLFYVYSNSNKLHQLGVTSFSFSECAAPGSTPWYIKVVHFKQGIYNLVTKNRYRGMWIRYRVGRHRKRLHRK